MLFKSLKGIFYRICGVRTGHFFVCKLIYFAWVVPVKNGY